MTTEADVTCSVGKGPGVRTEEHTHTRLMLTQPYDQVDSSNTRNAWGEVGRVVQQRHDIASNTRSKQAQGGTAEAQAATNTS
jgi:hypothetical protein